MGKTQNIPPQIIESGNLVIKTLDPTLFFHTQKTIHLLGLTFLILWASNL
jgi:hypothetical protein